MEWMALRSERLTGASIKRGGSGLRVAMDSMLEVSTFKTTQIAFNIYRVCR